MYETEVFLLNLLQVYNGSLNEPYTNPRAPVHITTGSAVSIVLLLYVSKLFRICRVY
jgi:hypothetical protein